MEFVSIQDVNVIVNRAVSPLIKEIEELKSDIKLRKTTVKTNVARVGTSYLMAAHDVSRDFIENHREFLGEIPTKIRTLQFDKSIAEDYIKNYKESQRVASKLSAKRKNPVKK